MWSRRKLIDFQRLSPSPHEAALVTGTFVAQQSSRASTTALTLGQDEFHCVASLAYTLIPQISDTEALSLSQWCFAQWMDDSAGEALPREKQQQHPVVARVIHHFTQVEYFFAGTDNGQLFMAPLMPSHLIDAILSECGEEDDEDDDATHREARALFAPLRAVARTRRVSSDAVPVNCGPRRLVHQHSMEEPVTALDHLGTLVASGSDDRSVALSFFHPVPRPVLTLTQPSPIRCLKLWEGGAFVRGGGAELAADDNEATTQRQRWKRSMHDQESAAVYLFVGDEAALVRLWRVDVRARTHVLLHVLVCTTRTRPVHSSLDMLSMEDPKRPVISRETTQSVHCMTIDADARLIAGSHEGLYVWNLEALSWKASDSALNEHPLQWHEEQHCPLSVADVTAESQLATVRMRATRLVNLHVVVRAAAYVQAQLEHRVTAQAASTASIAHDASPAALPPKARASTWKPKYGRMMTGGAAVGTVTNAVYVPEDACTLAEVLEKATVSLTFEDGELNNDVRLPLSCVEPVVYPLCFLPTYRSSCFAVEVLEPNRRLVSSGSNGKIVLWSWSAADERYLPTVAAGIDRQFFRGLGRRLCVLRTPDVFISCGYDDGLVKEWHVYEEPELLVRCERRFTMMPANAYARAAGAPAGERSVEASAAQKASDAMKNILARSEPRSRHHDNAESGSESESESTEEDALKKSGEVVGGISCAVAFPAFAALFLVGAFEHTVQTFSLSEVQGCEAPRNFIYNGMKTVKLPASLVEDAYRRLDESTPEA